MESWSFILNDRSSSRKYGFIAIILSHDLRSNWGLAFIVELLIETRRDVVFTPTIVVAGSDLFVGGGINLLMKSLTLLSLIRFPGIGNVSTYEGLGWGVFDVVAILTSLLHLLIKHLDYISCKVFIIE